MEESPPAIVLLSRDLFSGSQILGTARALGLEARQISSVDQFAPSAATRLVLIDLTLPAIDPAAIVALWRAAEPGERPRIVAFGPHVHEQLLDAARDAGCDEVLTRGQFISQLQRVLAG